MDEEKKDLPQSFLEEVRQEREAMDKTNVEMKQLLNELRELRAVEILSGKTEAGKPTEVKKETPQEYAQRMLRGG